MLRPATPLSVLLFAAFGLLLLSVLSTPIISAIPLSSFDGVNYGVFGFCRGADCSGIQIGYDVAALAKDNNSYDLPGGVRNTLAPILIVHPVAALLTLIMFIMAVVAHLHSPSHSARYLLVVFIFSTIDFAVCLLAFLIDVLIFVPHMAWGTYVVLAATIMVGLSGLVSCAMRRTLVSRKARKKEIAENAEMSGENYYNRENQIKAATVASQPTMPVLSGGNGGADNLPQFASFEDQKKDDQVSDERIPLTSRSPTNRSLNHMPSDIGSTTDVNSYNNAPPSRAGSVPRPERDAYGNPINAQQDPYGVRRMPSQETNRSFERMNSRGRGGMPPGGYRGRGGYGQRGGYGPPRGGGYGPRGRGGHGGAPPNGRGGYGPRGGGYGGAVMMAGPGRGPPGYRNEQDPYNRRGSPSDPYGQAGPYSTNNSTNPSLPSVSQGSYEAYNPQRQSLPRAESPPPLPGDEPAGPVGLAVEMDATSGSPGHPPQNFGTFNGIRESDADIAGMVGLQQGRSASAQARHETYMSDGSKYSTDDQYVPPRQAWGQGQGRSSPHAPSPLGTQQPPVELADRRSPTQPANNYYEDVDPRFASTPLEHPQSQPQQLQSNATPPDSYEDTREQRRARSPAGESDRSNFTSISQRSVNPRWNPNPPPMPGYGGHPVPRRPAAAQQRQDMLLNNNPDFQISSRVGSPPRGGAGGMVPGSSYPQGPL